MFIRPVAPVSWPDLADGCLRSPGVAELARSAPELPLTPWRVSRKSYGQLVCSLGHFSQIVFFFSSRFCNRRKWNIVHSIFCRLYYTHYQIPFNVCLLDFFTDYFQFFANCMFTFLPILFHYFLIAFQFLEDFISVLCQLFFISCRLWPNFCCLCSLSCRL